MSAPPLDRVIGMRGAATPDELAAVLAALTRRPAAMGDRYEQWRRSRVAVGARSRVARSPVPRLSSPASTATQGVHRSCRARAALTRTGEAGRMSVRLVTC
jgi:hypothetical protein